MILVLATHNKHKRDELLSVLSSELGSGVEIRTLDDITPPIGDIEETGTTLEENARIKAVAVHQATGLPTVADDTGLEVEALDGEPGVYSARYAGESCSYQDNVDKLLREMTGIDNRVARFRTVLCYIDVDGHESFFSGEVNGSITRDARGTAGFGYDPVFAPSEDNLERTFAEMPADEKNAISHRGRALRNFAEHMRRSVQ